MLALYLCRYKIDLGTHAKKAKADKHFVAPRLVALRVKLPQLDVYQVAHRERVLELSMSVKEWAKQDRTYTRFLPTDNIVVVTSDSILACCNKDVQRPEHPCIRVASLP